MKHPSSRALYAYWNTLRAGRAAPERGELNPGAIRTILGDVVEEARERDSVRVRERDAVAGIVAAQLRDDLAMRGRKHTEGECLAMAGHAFEWCERGRKPRDQRGGSGEIRLGNCRARLAGVDLGAFLGAQLRELFI